MSGEKTASAMEYIEELLRNATDLSDAQEASQTQTPPSANGPLERSDYGAALYAYERVGGDFLYTESLGWLAWTGTHWKREGAQEMAQQAVTRVLVQRCSEALQRGDFDFVRSALPTARRVRDVLFHLKAMLVTETNRFDAEPFALNCANGVVDLRTGAIKPHAPSNRFTYCVPTAYRPDARSELWEKLLQEWFDGDEDVIAFVQRAMGYTITGDSREECLFYLYGPGRAGKGTLINTVAELLGAPLAQGVPLAAFTASSGDPQNFRLAPLRAARMVVASESRRGDAFNEALVKQITGNDPVQAAFKHGQPFTFTPRFKLWIMSNEPPRGDVDDDAFWWRIRLIEMRKSRMDDADNGIKTALAQREHREAILAWLVRGSAEWIQKGLGKLEKLDQAKKRVREEQDHVAQWMLDRCTVGDGLECDTTTLYASYADWCAEAGVERAKLSKRGLTHRLGKKGFAHSRVRRGHERMVIVYGLKV